MGIFIYDVAPLAPNEAERDEVIVASGGLSLSGHPALTAIADEAAERYRTRCATITLIHRDWQYILAAHGQETGVTRRSGTLCAHAILRPERVFLVLDAALDARFAENPNVVHPPHLRFYAGAALTVGDVALGTVCVFDPSPRQEFDAAERASLHGLARRATEALLRHGRVAAPRPALAAATVG